MGGMKTDGESMESNVDFEQERARLTRRAWRVTSGYAIALFVLSTFVFFGEEGVDAFLTMSPNEVGDLLAGIAGPVAFIWLVYGYFLQGIAIRQQAEELRLNTKALELQAEELKNSVEQQRELVDVSRRQFEAQLNALEQEKEKQKASSQPTFVFYTEGVTISPDDQLVTKMSMENIGAAVVNVEFSWGSQVGHRRLRDMTTFESGRKVPFSWSYKKDAPRDELWLAIEFSDRFGGRHKHFFDFLPGGIDGFFNGVMVNRR